MKNTATHLKNDFARLMTERPVFTVSTIATRQNSDHSGHRTVARPLSPEWDSPRAAYERRQKLEPLFLEVAKARIERRAPRVVVTP